MKKVIPGHKDEAFRSKSLILFCIWQCSHCIASNCSHQYLGTICSSWYVFIPSLCNNPKNLNTDCHSDYICINSQATNCSMREAITSIICVPILWHSCFLLFLELHLRLCELWWDQNYDNFKSVINITFLKNSLHNKAWIHSRPFCGVAYLPCFSPWYW